MLFKARESGNYASQCTNKQLNVTSLYGLINRKISE